jgi:hypothetical protein
MRGKMSGISCYTTQDYQSSCGMQILWEKWSEMNGISSAFIFELGAKYADHERNKVINEEVLTSCCN